MSKQWHNGPPPSIGWWPASTVQQEAILRWWDGRRWSLPCTASMDAHHADHNARLSTTKRSCHIQWQDRPASWPARSRT